METLAKQSLFWDIDRSALDPEAHRRFIVERILARGDVDDVRWAKEYYGIDTLRDVFLQSKTLDAKSVVFWSYYFSQDVCISKPSLRKRAVFWRH